MDAIRFDRLTRFAAGRRLSRRAALRGGLGAGLATALGGASAAAQGGTLTSTAGMATPALASPSGKMTVRKNGKKLSPAEKRAYTDAVRALKQKPSPWAPPLSVYDTFVLWHRDSFNCDIMTAHMGPAFFPWHRVFVRLFELELQAVDPTVSVPYWDWTVDNQKDSYVWQADFMGGDGDPNQGYVVTTGPFRKGKWTIEVFDYNDPTKNPSIIRYLGGSQMSPTLSTPAEVEAALSVSTYDAPPWNTLSPIAQSFRNTLEGWRDCVTETCDPVVGMSPTCTGPHPLHNGVHLWVAGEFAFNHEVATEQKFNAQLRKEEATPGAKPLPQNPETSATILGTMAANSSNSDPVFYLVHANIDRLWNEWQRRHGPHYLPVSGGPFGQNLHDAMWPYNMIGLTISPAMVLDSRALGYMYDTD